jgi:hypothetical protein
MLTMALCIGCSKKKEMMKVAPGPQDPLVQEQATTKWNVDHTISLLLNGPDGDPAKRVKAAKRAGKMIEKPDLTSEMKAQLIDALKKMIEAEPMSEAEDEYKKTIQEEGEKALKALQGG